MDVFNGCFSSIKEIKRAIDKLLNKGMINIYLKVTIEKKWRTQNFDFVTKLFFIKSSPPGQLLENFNLRRYRCKVQQQDSNPQPLFVNESSIFWPVLLNGWVFVYELNGCRFESRYCHLNFRYCVCFEQGVPRDSGNYRV